MIDLLKDILGITIATCGYGRELASLSLGAGGINGLIYYELATKRTRIYLAFTRDGYLYVTIATYVSTNTTIDAKRTLSSVLNRLLLLGSRGIDHGCRGGYASGSRATCCRGDGWGVRVLPPWTGELSAVPTGPGGSVRAGRTTVEITKEPLGNTKVSRSSVLRQAPRGVAVTEEGPGPAPERSAVS